MCTKVEYEGVKMLRCTKYGLESSRKKCRIIPVNELARRFKYRGEGLDDRNYYSIGCLLYDPKDKYNCTKGYRLIFESEDANGWFDTDLFEQRVDNPHYQGSQEWDYEIIINYAKEYDKEKNSGCFLTTVICDRLGMDDTCYLLERFRIFREEHLNQSKYGQELLYRYRLISQDISPLLMTDSEDFIRGLFETELAIILNCIEDNNPNRATVLYEEMVVALQKRYRFHF